MANAQGAEIYYLEWDDENELHLASHGISPTEARELLSNSHITMSNPRAEGRITLVGRTNGGRILSLALDPTDDAGAWRPVTGLPATPVERRLLGRYCG